MKKIYNNLNIENLIKTEWFNQFDICQQEVIRIGLEQNLNASIYAKKEFNDQQMNQIREGLEKGLNVSIYANPDFTEKEMRKIKRELIKKAKKR